MACVSIMRASRFGISLMCLALGATAWGQTLAPVTEPPPPPALQKMPMGFRPIRPPQLAPLQAFQPVPGPDVQVPLAPPDPSQFYRPQQVFSPPGVNGQPGQRLPYNYPTSPNYPVPGQPLQPVLPGQALHQPNFQAATPVPIYTPPAPSQPATYLAWDAERKETNTQPGQASAQFTFWLTNVSSEVVSIHSAHTSCGCSVAQLPAQPWNIPPGSNGPINVTMNLAGKFGSIEKAVTINSTTGYKSLIFRVNIPSQPVAPGQPQPAITAIDPDRLKNMQMALTDRQVLFKGDCAKCHADTAVGKTGEPLYAAACGICHNSPHRAAMVPDLAKLNHPTNDDHWRKWIRSGRVGSMMPAFAKAEGGPLSDEQVDSLVKFLMDSITAKAGQAPAPGVATSVQAVQTGHDVVGAPKSKLQ
jgi:mono/diheme cytochrome c family protein